jgi:hypothetical protein
MAGAATTYFTSKVNQYEPVVAAAQQAATKLAAAHQALQLLSKATLTQAEAESLIALQVQSE